jgi:hypothetical protein
MTSSNNKKEEKRQNKFCTLKNFVSEGMETIGEKHSNHPALEIRNTTRQHVDFLNKNNLRKWKAAYGVRPLVAYDAWLRIKEKAPMRGIMAQHLFWCLHWMKTYGTEDNVARTLRTTSKTLRRKVRNVIKLLSNCIYSVVRQEEWLIQFLFFVVVTLFQFFLCLNHQIFFSLLSVTLGLRSNGQTV